MLANKDSNEGEGCKGYRPCVAVICQNTILQAFTEQALSLSAQDPAIVDSLKCEQACEQGSAGDQEEPSLIISDTIQTLESMSRLSCPKILFKKGRSTTEPADISGETAISDFVEIALPVRWGTFAKRLENILSSSLNVQDIHFAGYCLSGAHSLLTQEDTGDIKRLTEKERDMLFFFYKNRDRAVSREEILANVWGYADTAETHTVETHIYRLRQKIEKDPTHPEIIITDDEGYRVLF